MLSTGLVLAIFAALLSVRQSIRTQAQERIGYNSPDGRFRIVVYVLPKLFGFPGQGSDAPGFVRLYEKATGKILAEKDVEMVQLVDEVTWSGTNVSIKLFTDWKLPN